MTDRTNQPFYQAAPTADVLVSAGSPGYLVAIIVGADVAASVIEVSNHATEGDGAIKIKLAGATLLGSYPVGAYFPVGITADIVNQTDVTFVWRKT